MATFTKLPSGKWRVQVRKRGLYKSSTFDKKTQARDWAAAIESQVNQGRTGLITTRATLRVLVDHYLDNAVAKGKAGETYLRVIQREIGHIRLDQLSQAHLETWAEGRLKIIGGNTLAAYLSYLGTVLSYGRESRKLNIRDGMTKAALRAIKRRGHRVTSVERDRIPTQAELDRLYTYWREGKTRLPMEEICRFAIASCMRQGEITRITHEDLDRDNKTILIRERKNPRQKLDEVVPLIGEAWAILEAKTGTGRIYPYDPQSISTRFTRTCRALGIHDLHFHDLRHLGITNLFKMGLSIQHVSIVSGHKSWSHLKRYTQLQATDVHAALK